MIAMRYPCPGVPHILLKKLIQSLSMTVLYKYEVASSLRKSSPQKEENPPITFCTYVLSKNRLYTKKEIKEMSELLGYDVFKYKGGNGCIHTWKKVIKPKG